LDEAELRDNCSVVVDERRQVVRTSPALTLL